MSEQCLIELKYADYHERCQYSAHRLQQLSYSRELSPTGRPCTSRLIRLSTFGEHLLNSPLASSMPTLMTCLTKIIFQPAHTVPEPLRESGQSTAAC